MPDRCAVLWRHVVSAGQAGRVGPLEDSEASAF